MGRGSLMTCADQSPSDAPGGARTSSLRPRGGPFAYGRMRGRGGTSLLQRRQQSVAGALAMGAAERGGALDVARLERRDDVVMILLRLSPGAGHCRVQPDVLLDYIAQIARDLAEMPLAAGAVNGAVELAIEPCPFRDVFRTVHQHLVHGVDQLLDRGNILHGSPLGR